MADQDDFSVNYDNKQLRAMLAAFKNKTPVARVGVLGSKSHRNEGSDVDSAFIGSVHEFGSQEKHIPPRSFLRMPISQNLESYMEKAGALDPDTLKKIINDKSLKSFVKKIGVLCVKIVNDAFDTGGFGQWPKSNMKYKKTQQTLVETRQLQRSIGYEVKE